MTTTVLMAAAIMISPIVAGPTDVLVDAGEKPAAMVPAYLDGLAHEAFDRRHETLEKILTPEDAEAYQERSRAAMFQALGGFPEKTPLNAQVLGSGARPGFRYERIMFESQPGFHVTATLYLPDAPGPHPVVLLPCGHYPEAKAVEDMQRVAIFLALNGIASMNYDPIGQGERAQILNEDGTQKFGSTVEHLMVGVGSILLGTNTATFRVWDGIRAIDYLESRADLDITRLGCTGVSGGGTLTSYLMALDARILAAAPVCYITSSKRLLETIGPQDAEQNIFGQIVNGFTVGDYPILHAPKPTLICCATRDFFDITGTWDSFREAKRFFGVLGLPEHVDLVETNADHAYSKPLREAMVRFMLRHLRNMNAQVTEPEFDVIPINELQCTPDGQVLKLPGERSVIDINTAAAESMDAQRMRAWLRDDSGKALAQVRRLANIRPADSLPEPKFTERNVSDINGMRAVKGLIESEPGIVLPVVLLTPPAASTKVCLFVHGDGKAAAVEDPRIASMVNEGWTVLCPDLRGLGETKSTSKLAQGYGEYFGDEWQEYYVAYWLGKSYVGMRAEDIVQCVRALPQLLQAEPVEVRLLATGVAYVPALHAAALEAGLIQTFELDPARTTWTEVVKTAVTRNQLINTVHGALQHYDLPDLERAIVSRQKTQTNP